MAEVATPGRDTPPGGATRVPGPRPIREPSTRTVLWVLGVLATAALLVIAVGGYLLHWSWTGYLDSDSTPPTPRPLWDWLNLLLQPLTLLLLPLWLRSRSRGGSWLGVALVVAALFLVLVIGGYTMPWRWTGFTGNTASQWLGLFLVPFLLPVAVTLLLPERRPEAVAVPAPTRTRGTDRRTSLVLAAAAGALGAVVLLAVGFSAGRLGADPTPGPAARSVTVDAQNPDWTDSQVRVTSGEQVRITASGRVWAHRTYPGAGPEGLERGDQGHKDAVPHVPHAALLATVAAIGQPGRLSAVSPAAAGSVRLVGRDLTLRAPRDGELFLGINDRVTTDNHGWFQVEVTPGAG
jgi:hypothetical protein